MNKMILNTLDNIYAQLLISEMYKMNLIDKNVYETYLHDMFKVLAESKGIISDE